MNPQDQAAQEWAKANPKDPRSQHILAKIWANQNPEDPRAAKVLENISQANSTPPEQAPPQAPPQPNPFDVANAQDAQQKASGKPNPTRDDPEFKKFVSDTAVTPDQVNMMGANALLPGMGSKLASGMGSLGKLGIGTMMGATQGAANSPSSPEQGAVAGGIAGAGGSMILGGLQRLLGGIKGAAGNVGTAMQIHKADPDLYQAAKGKIEDAMSALSNPGPSQNQGGADYLSKLTQKPITSLTAPNVDKRAMINSLGSESGTDLASYAKQLRLAKQTSSNPVKSGIVNTVKAGINGASNAGSGQVNDPTTLAVILNMMQSQQQNK